ncbi:MAG TPA: histidine--tRNA ligase [Lachnospiraceae bacterium]|nr:histidine--tRNA ligase [Lachnospiraceae bacterium]
MRTSTVKGTRDFLPSEMKLRDYMQNRILNVYRNSGFSRISTPILEDIENLDKSEGGENLNLIFRVLKRGNKLKSALDKGQFNNISDIGLRYDLTLPLSRYYASNKEKLMLPFKCIQIDKVYRAERPQRGRDREFIQCDIDIIGSDSIDSEIELIYTTSKALTSVGIYDFTVKLNDRRLLKALLISTGIDESQVENVCISIDKLDKIGIDGLKAELIDRNINHDIIERITAIVDSKIDLDEIESLTGEKQIIEGLKSIISAVRKLSNGTCDIQFDLSLVRGQGYYTGTIFEIESKTFHSSIGGGGRYDNLIGKFTGEKVPAVGFSIGFERIYSLLSTSGFLIPDSSRKIAIIYRSEDFLEAYSKAESFRDRFDVELFEMPRKLGKFIDKLSANGFYGFLVYGDSSTIKQITE